MARFRFQFGKGESLNCLPGIERFDIGTADGTQNVCYAAKVATESVILPWRTYVDDYVFAVDGSNFYNTTRESIRAEQAAGRRASASSGRRRRRRRCRRRLGARRLAPTAVAVGARALPGEGVAMQNLGSRPL